MSENELDYVARFPGMPGYGAWCAYHAEDRRAIAKTVADWIRRGASVERVTTAEARDGLMAYAQAKTATGATP